MSRPPTPPSLAPHVPLKERLYPHLPRSLQSLALGAEGWLQRRERYGGDFVRRLAAYERADRLSADEIHDIRRQKLRALLTHAARKIPFWAERFRDAGLDLQRVDGPDDLAVLPVLTKAEILAAGPKLIAGGADPKSLRKVHTSGTTGAGLVFFTTVDAIRDQWAVWWRYRRRHKLELTTWAASFAGRSIVPGDKDDPRPWRTNRPGRQVLFSQYHLRADNAHLYARAIAERGLSWIHGYPSFVAYFAQLLAARGIDPPRPSVVTLGAENLFGTQARLIEEVLGVRPKQHYGLAEMVANASECAEGRLHVDEDFAAVELVPAGDGMVRIVGTSLANFAMPFIRYDTGDLARPVSAPCPCGLPGRVLEAIDGRSEDLLELTDGTRVGRLDHLFKDALRVAEAQIRQVAPGRCTIAVVPRAGFGSRDRDALLEECRARFGDRLEVDVELVDAIPRTSGGKLRLVVREGASR